MRDAADLYLSLKHPPVVFINDTPCGFVRHLECRDPVTAQRLWGENGGCFEKPTLGKDPEQVRYTVYSSVPSMIPYLATDPARHKKMLVCKLRSNIF